MTPTGAPSKSPAFSPDRELFPFESRWFESAAGRVHYVDEGAGQPILMCHGNPTWSFLYRRVVQALRGRFRCIAVDYPGFGLSERPPRYGYTAAEHAAVVEELVRALDLHAVIVMGHDWGGPIGLSAACSEPDRVAGFVLGNTWFWPSDLRARVFSRVLSSGPMQRAILDRNFFVERLLPLATGRRLSPAEMDHYRRVQPTAAARIGVAEFPRQLVAAGSWLARLEGEVSRQLGRKPVLVTYPMRDPAFPAASVLPRMRAAFADIEVVELPAAKHFFLEDAPDEVADAIVERFGRP